MPLTGATINVSYELSALKHTISFVFARLLGAKLLPHMN
jgi:hypothetical protein